ncbi:tapetum-specific zinc finger protein 1 [Striga asiatica]|uniref:Tapetum-specific zinc finger protein 1 n=1 Tax=Striga asiatica TaxID=4170 RepID=A0A5A7RAF7_STRAF|nr:tapetum-specific zinc finger protein 1 [Striga asiatica]
MEHEDRENSDDCPSSTDRKNSQENNIQEQHDISGEEEEEEEDRDVIINSPESMMFIPTAPERRHQCKECEKIFSSGKALGGHMSSAHVQASKDYSFKKLKSKITGSRAHLSSSEDNACPICGKLFHSQKSLYGHMRCHPDREWRGMEPPRLGTTSQDQDFGDSLRGWPVKARRGRRPQHPQPQPLLEDDEEAVWAGHQLLSLLKPNLGPGQENSAHDSKRQKITIPQVKIRNTNSTGKGKVVKMDDSKGKGKGKGKTDFLPGPENPESENGLFFTAIGVLVNGTRENHPNQSLDGLCDSSADKYACSMCSKVFPTHQALGGHKSSHNKFKISIVNAVDQFSTSEDKNLNRKARNNGDEQKEGQLKCDDNGGNSKDKGKVVWGFDLNMIPDDEDVEDLSGEKYEV